MIGVEGNDVSDASWLPTGKMLDVKSDVGS